MTLTSSRSTDTTRGTVALTIDGRSVDVPEGTTIWQAARDLGIDIPTLCHDERYDPVGVCRLCVVDVGGRAYAAACIRPCEDGMEVATATPEIESRRKVLTELLIADQRPREEDPKETTTADNELLAVAELLPHHRRGRPVRADPAAVSTCPTRSSRSTTTPASCAIAASARATTSRGTTSSAAAARATPPASRSTSTTRWASPPASPAGSACRPAPPVR